jgi:hypothetical protein
MKIHVRISSVFITIGVALASLFGLISFFRELYAYAIWYTVIIILLSVISLLIGSAITDEKDLPKRTPKKTKVTGYPDKKVTTEYY